MSYNCELIEQLARPALAMRARAAVQDLPRVLGEAYGAVMQYLGPLGEAPAGPPYVAYFNEDMQNLDIEAGFPVARPLPGQGKLQAVEIPGGKAASCLYVGPYSDCGPAYEALTKWMRDHGYEPTGVAYEIYLNDPQQTPPEALQTQIVFPLKTA